MIHYQLRISNVSRGATASLADQEHCQNNQFRFDGMAIARVREYEVVRRGVKGDEPSEKPRPWPLLPQRKKQSPDRQY
jgi:hypothetical protein